MQPLPLSNAPSYWWSAAVELARRDPVLAPIIARFPGEALAPHGDIFRTLARAIVGQQISVVAAESIWRRLEDHVGVVGPEAIAEADVERLRACGLTRRKADYLVGIARTVPEGDARWQSWLELDDDALSGVLENFPGVGPWTCHMVLIFAAGRPDVLPLADIGLRRAAGRHYGAGDTQLDAEALARIGERWRPWRSIAVWYLWRLLDPVPVAY
jgi:DNA-3-methyladenine glycosylase II